MLISTELRRWKLSLPHTAAHGSTRERTTLLLRVEHEGLVGWGEAAPLPSYDGGDLDTCRGALEALVPTLADSDPDAPQETCGLLADGAPPQARAALLTALQDLAARRVALPLWRFLGADRADPVRVSRLVERNGDVEVATTISDSLDQGFTAFKFKVGLDDDLRFAEMVRSEAGSRATLIADANGCWDPGVAETELVGLASIPIDMVEQPVSGVVNLRRLTAAGHAPTALDEDATDPEALGRIQVANAVCLKLQAWGGIDRMSDAASKARESRLGVYLGSSLEGPVGIAAALHASHLIEPDLPCGLATLDSFEGVFPSLRVDNGTMRASDRPGLGTDPDGNPV